jgi:hypothetical protein
VSDPIEARYEFTLETRTANLVGQVQAWFVSVGAQQAVIGALEQAGARLREMSDTDIDVPKTDVFGGRVDDWPDQVIRCKHCGLPLNRIDLPPPEGPDMKGIHGWIHHGVSGPGSAVFCPSRTLGGPSLGIAEPSDYVKTLFDRAIRAARAAAPEESDAD